ncbi:1-acyl-sn-glycerol-3-phosphate acyltransferase [Chloroflexi bacterium TSY]|nr:1-acyl-sn-glycerol-3-phosphate acyltransferase [Chloroflexi bacterium TSY]
MRNHHGLVVGNHLSYLDPILLAAVLPVRFLAAAGVRRLPLIGWFASALDTVYVDRKNQASRIAARQEIAQQLEKRTFPPLALFPEGSTGPGDRVLPFRRGTFEIAAEEGIAILPFVIVYAPLAAFHYYGEDDNLPKAIWRLANYPGKIQAYLRILSAIHPEQSSDPEATAVGIADETYAQIARLYTDLITRED